MAAEAAKDDDSSAGQALGSPAEVLRSADDFDRNVWSVLGVPIDYLEPAAALAKIERAVRVGEKLSFVTPNVNFLVRASRNPEERRHILNADLSLVDGAPLVVIARMLGMRSLTRCAGSDLFDALRKRPAFAGQQIRVFFFGGRHGAAEAAARAIDTEDRGLQSSGWLNPGYGDIDEISTPQIIDKINAAEQDFLVVALGASKGQAWIDKNLSRLNAAVIAHLGAVVDFTAGSIRRAPVAVRRAGLEWAWRILAEPSLWVRYWKDGIGLFGIVATRLMPAISSMRRLGQPPAAQLFLEPGRVRIKLSGDLSADNLESVRTAFRAANRTSADVLLDFSLAGSIDAAFLGLVLMLEKATSKRAASVLVTGLDKSIRRRFKANLMTYREIASDVADKRETGEAGIAAAN
ncbi:MAG: WecB/TagA/CpsF family glycosyltransferase [Parvularculaceae bacterium]|nr:WecB/TagA/CpsF family glycosyltransferase [Parvularculaceae bacterium]